MTHLDSILKSRDVNLLTKVCVVNAMVFLVVIYGCESWTIKKDECWRTDAFELCCWRRLLRVLWTARRTNQSILKEINLEYSLEGPMLKLKHQYFGHLMERTDTLENTLILGKIKGRRRGNDRGWDGWMSSLTRWTWIEQTPGDGEGQGSLAYCSPWGHRVRHDWVTGHQQHNLSLFFQWVTEIRRLAQDHIPKSLWSFSLCYESKHCCSLQVPLTNSVSSYIHFFTPFVIDLSLIFL